MRKSKKGGLLTAIVTSRHQIRRDRTRILAKRVERLGLKKSTHHKSCVGDKYLPNPTSNYSLERLSEQLQGR